MARWYLPMKNEIREERGVIKGGGMARGQDADNPAVVKVPPMFVKMGAPPTVPLKAGGISIGLVDHGFIHIGPGECIDLPDSVPSHSIRNMAPQLLNKEQAIEAGLANPDGTLKQQQQAAPQPARKQ